MDRLPLPGLQYGLDGPLESLDEEQKELIKEAFASDPAWSAKVGTASNPVVIGSCYASASAVKEVFLCQRAICSWTPRHHCGQGVSWSSSRTM